MNKLIRIALVNFVAIMAHFPVTSQALYPVSFDEKVEKSTLIIEGKVKGKTSFWNPSHTMIYTSNTIEVYKIFKGTLVTDTIEVMTHGGSVGDESVEVSDLLELYKGDVGVFFCQPNTINLKSPKSKRLLWDVYSSAQGCLKYNLAEGSASAPFEKYNNIQTQFYSRIQQKTKRLPQIINKSFKPFLQQSFRVSAPPVISNFLPATVKAGAYAESSENVLTINGSGFGTASGSAGINFDNPDDGIGGTGYFVAATSDLIVSWADAQIIVKVPAKVGTGTFSVVESAGSSGSSPSALQVKYAIINNSTAFGTSPTFRQYSLMNLNGSGGYDFLYSTSTAGGGADLSVSSYKDAFERALNTWREVAGLNFTNTGTTSLQAVASDGLNIIMMDNTNTGVAVLPAGVLGVTYSWGSSCTSTQYIRRTGFDIVIRNPGVSTGTYNFNLGPCKTSTSTTEYDLETTLLHELGHALNLGHINDAYIGASLPNIDPGKLMHYASVNGTDRRSPDWSSLAGAVYCINPRGLSYPCTPQTEMIPLTTTVESKDECPVTFPSSPTSGNTLISFDLNHATSNKNGDPQYTAINCAGTGTAVSNTAYYAIKTNSTGGALTFAISGYTTAPTAQQSCSGAGIELALYQTSSCPAGQSFPSPVACRTFNADGVLSSITGLASNTDYLLMVDGISNTKATFDLLINGSSLPVKIALFTGNSLAGHNSIKWKAENNLSVNRIILESSSDGITFADLYSKNIIAGTSIIEDNFNDYAILPVKYYRLKMYTTTGPIQYSDVISLKQTLKNTGIVISPNPVSENMSVSFYKETAGPVTFYLFDMAGKLLNSENILAASGEQKVNLSLAKGIAKGNYILKINMDKKASSHKILVQ